MDKNNTPGRYANSRAPSGEGSRLREGPGAVPLGIYAKTEASQQPWGFQVDQATGEILDAPADPKRHRAERFALKSVVNRLLLLGGQWRPACYLDRSASQTAHAPPARFQLGHQAIPLRPWCSCRVRLTGK